MEGSNTLISHSLKLNNIEGLASVLYSNKNKSQDYNYIINDNLPTTNLSPIEKINDYEEVIEELEKRTKEILYSPVFTLLKYNLKMPIYSFSDSSLSISENNKKIQTKKICDLKFKRRLNFNSDSFSNQN